MRWYQHAPRADEPQARACCNHRPVNDAAPPLRDLLPPPDKAEPLSASAGFVRVSLPAYGVRVLAPDLSAQDGYSVYKRVR